jgi:hypothetical protein
LYTTRTNGGIKMWQDPIVKEVREFREKCAAGLKHDTEAIFNDICKRQNKSGRSLVELPSRKPQFKKKAA